MAEFTGERVIPGQVDIDLWNEHVARYAFAARLARGRRVLDAGCGTGYGAAELARHAVWVAGVDLSGAAIEHAQAHYAAVGIEFLRASCTSLPFRDASFQLVVAFEVIEHLSDWRALLEEARRLLAPGGQFVVSTPNQLYYAESRKLSGPNPYHEHEFTLDEFRAELSAVFPHVLLFAQNHVDGVSFRPLGPAAGADIRVENGAAPPEESHFFLAVCAASPQTGAPAFVYLPNTGNVLREREQHIERLELEIATKNAWLEQAQRDHQELLELYRAQTAELEQRTKWGEALDRQLKEAGDRIVDLQEELKREQAAWREAAEAYEAKVTELDEENRKKTEWAQETERRLTAEVEVRSQELGRAVEALHAAEATVEERTHWALRLNKEIEELNAKLSMVQASRWVRMGRVFGLGPELRNT